MHGGVGRYVHTFALGLSRHPKINSIHVVTQGIIKKPIVKKINEKINITILPLTRHLPQSLEFIINSNAYLWKKSKTYNIDIIHIQEPNYYIGINILKNLGRRLVITYHGHHFQDFKASIPKSLKHLSLYELAMYTYFSLWQPLTYKVCNEARGHVFPSNYLKNIYENSTTIKGIKKVLPHGISISYIEKELNADVKDYWKDLLKRLEDFISSKNHIAIFYGRLIYRKGIVNLLVSFYKLIRKYHMNRIGLIIVGKGSMRKYIANFIGHRDMSKNVVIIENVPTSVLYKLIGMSDTVINPTLYEAGVPYTALEALALKKPLILSRLPMIAEFLRDEEVIFIDPYNIDDIVNKILYVYDNYSYAIKVALNGYQKVKNEYNPEIYAEKMVELYLNVLNLGEVKRKAITNEVWYT